MGDNRKELHLSGVEFLENNLTLIFSNEKSHVFKV